MSATLEQCLEAERLRAEREAAPLHEHCGCWHVVLDDPNYSDDIVRSCAEDANGPYCNAPHICRALAPLLLAMSRTQRAKLASGGYKR